MHAKRGFRADEEAVRPLTLMIRTQVFTLDGSWRWTKTELPYAPPSTYDYVVNVNNQNHLLYPGDESAISKIELAPEEKYEAHFRIVSPQGTVHDLNLQGTFQRQPSGGKTETAAPDRRAQQAITKYHELFISIDQGFAIIELLYDEMENPIDYIIDEANPAIEQLTGFRNIAGKRISALMSDVPEQWYLLLDKILRSQVPTRFTTKAIELGGAWYDIYVFPTGDPAAHKLGILFNDITDRVHAEQSLRDKQMKLDIAQREGRVGIWTYYPSSGYGIASREWMDLMGYPGSEETWSLKTFLSLVDPEDVPVLMRALDQTRTQRSVEAEFRTRHASRHLQWFLIRGSYVPSLGDGQDALMGSIIDITDRKAFEEQKDEFIAMASHELKTPVTSIRAYAEILHHNFQDSKGTMQTKMMSRMINQIDRLTRLINDLLDTTRITSGGLVLEPEELDLNTLLRDCVDELQRTTTHKLTLQTTELPLITVDKERIRQVLANLLSNAIKYSPAGSQVIVSSDRAADHVTVKVRDYGMGLPEDVRHRIFDRFYRESTVIRNTIPGLGLGLFIASQIIRRHNGTIGVTSTVGEGSEFHFTLPLQPPT